MQNRVTPEAVIEFLGDLGMMESVSGSTDLKSFISIRRPEDGKFGSLSYLGVGEPIPPEFKGSMLICAPDIAVLMDRAIMVVCKNPRLAMAKVIAHFFMDLNDDPFEKFADGCFERRCRYTDLNTVLVGACVTIGSEGMGFVRDENGKLVRFLSVGGVQIHEGVELADHATIIRGEVGDTIIGAGSKIGHHSVIGANAVIERDVLIYDHVSIGERAVVEMGAVIMSNARISSMRIGAGAVIAAGSVVFDDVPPNELWAGKRAILWTEISDD